MQPWKCNEVVECGGVVVRPGDAIIGDQDGVVCVPAAVAQQVYDNAHGRESIEEIIKEELIKSGLLCSIVARAMASEGSRCRFASCVAMLPLMHVAFDFPN